MSSKYKLLIADIDGTLVAIGSDGKEIHVEHPVKQGFQRAAKSGKIITIATGRNYPKAKEIIDAFGINALCVINGGSQIVDAGSGKPVWEKRLDIDTAHKVIEYIKNIISDQDLRIGLGYIEEKPFSSITEEDIRNLIYIDLVGISLTNEVTKLVESVNSLPDAHAATVISPQFPGRTNIIITNKNATKLHAVEKLQELLNITKAETITIGDGNNDLPLFKAGGLKVAVDNADVDLKSAADLIVPSFHQHGILQIIDNYLLS